MSDQNISLLSDSRDKSWPSAASVAKKLAVVKRDDNKKHGNQKTNRITGQCSTGEAETKGALISNHFDNFNLVCSVLIILLVSLSNGTDPSWVVPYLGQRVSYTLPLRCKAPWNAVISDFGLYKNKSDSFRPQQLSHLQVFFVYMCHKMKSSHQIMSLYQTFCHWNVWFVIFEWMCDFCHSILYMWHLLHVLGEGSLFCAALLEVSSILFFSPPLKSFSSKNSGCGSLYRL